MIASSPKRRVLVLGIHDETYPRNERIRRYLESRGCTVDVIRKRGPGRVVWETGRLIRSALRSNAKWDVVICPEFGNELFVAAWLIARLNGAVFILDFFVGLHETRVVDRAAPSQRAIRSKLVWLADYLSVRLADRIITDTGPRARNFAAEFGSEEKWSFLPVGAPDWTELPTSTSIAPDSQQTVRLLHYGNYVQLHGIGVVLEGVRLASLRRTVQLTLIGDDRRRAEVESWLAARECTFSVQVLGSVEPAELADYIVASDVVLGVFGSSAKARSVIPNKVWQGLACGRTVMTGASSAFSDIRPLVGERLVEVDPNAESLAEAIVSLDPRLSTRDLSLGVALRDYVDDSFQRWYRRDFSSGHQVC